MNLTASEQALVSHDRKCPCAQCSGGRIVSRVTRSEDEEQQQPSTVTYILRCLAFLLMALLSSRKRLSCHYCNKKSRIIQDGSIALWQCLSCGQNNYLDENGDIADPPVAQELEAAGKSNSILSDPFFLPNQRRGDDPFCSTCLNNQRILRSALSELDVELDEDHPNYYESGRAFEQSKKKLEQLYPQVCDECAGIATERIMKTKYTAQADNFGRGLRRTKEARERANASWGRTIISFLGSGFRKETYLKAQTITFYDFMLFIAPGLRYYGQLLGVLFHSVTLLVSLQRLSIWYSGNPEIIEESLSWLPSNTGIAVPEVVTSLALNAYGLLVFAAISPLCAQPGFLMSLTSCWWNPYFREWWRGFTLHLSGFKSWYTFTYGSVIVRGLILKYMGTQIWEGPYVLMTIASHAAALFLITKASRAHIRRDMNALFHTSPERLPKAGSTPRNISPNNTDIADALEAISTKSVKQEPSLTASPSPFSRTAALPFQGKPNGAITRVQSNLHSPSQLPTLSTENDFRPRPQPGVFHEAFSNRYKSVGVEEMEWSPTGSPYRAFHNDLLDSRATGSFNNAPVGDKSSPFWYKVPSAPLSQAERAFKQHQPPNFRPTSQEVKENFFQAMTKRKSPIPRNRSTQDSKSQVESQHDFVMAQPRFFPPAENDSGDSLADCFGSITLTEAPPDHPQTRVWRGNRFVQFLLLCVSLLLWNIVPLIPPDISVYSALGAMLACCFVGFAVVPEHFGTKFEYRPKRSSSTHLLLASLGIGEMLAGALFILICSAGVSTFPLQAGGHASCWSAGNTLIGLMLAQEFVAWNF